MKTQKSGNQLISLSIIVSFLDTGHKYINHLSKVKILANIIQARVKSTFGGNPLLTVSFC